MMGLGMLQTPRANRKLSSRVASAATTWAVMFVAAVCMRTHVAALARRGLYPPQFRLQRAFFTSTTLVPPSLGDTLCYQHKLGRFLYQDREFRCRLFSDQLKTSSSEIKDEPLDEYDEVIDEDELVDSIILEENDENEGFRNLPAGAAEGFYVVDTYKTNESGFDLDAISSVITGDDITRLDLTPGNVSVPVALMILDPGQFPSMSRARKACRKASIIIHRGSLSIDEKTGENIFDSKKCQRAFVGDRVFPGDVLAKQVRMGDGYYPEMRHEKPPFDLPVVYEDDHFAIVNKPAGVVVYAHRQSGHGIMTVQAALPFSIQPPKVGTYSTMRRPQAVHRLDKPTSGLLIVAKTKPAMVDLSRQFRDRKVKKTYVAVCNGILPELSETSISSKEAHELGVDIDPDSDNIWQLIDSPLEEKSAVTIWRALKYAKSLKAKDNYLTLVELKPKTGRFHQLRRHMAWVCERPIIGDSVYDGGGEALQFRERGLFLCSNRVTLEHPYYNTEMGQKAFKKISAGLRKGKMECISMSEDGKVMVTVNINIPEKFESFLSRENDRFEVLSTERK